jgi:hypothetical protein
MVITSSELHVRRGEERGREGGEVRMKEGGHVTNGIRGNK